MTVRSNIILFGVLAMTSLFPARAWAQLPENTPRERSNLISLHTSIHEYFEGAPFIQWRHQGKPGWKNSWPGISYTHTFPDNNGLYLSITVVKTRYYRDFTYPQKRGDIMYREYGLFEGGYLRRLINGKKFDLNAIAGVSYRLGYESALNYIYGGWEVRVFDYFLSDWGAFASVRAALSLPLRLQLTSQAQFTEYFIRKIEDQPTWPVFPNRPTRHRMSFQLGLGFGF